MVLVLDRDIHGAASVAGLVVGLGIRYLHGSTTDVTGRSQRSGCDGYVRNFVGHG